jgi:hypothetical protein
VRVFPQIVWLSEHKAPVYGLSLLFLATRAWFAFVQPLLSSE